MLRIKCPSTDISKEDRCSIIFNEEFRRWITSPELVSLIQLFEPGFIFDSGMPLAKTLTHVKNFASENWDYRKKQKDAMTSEGEAARWLLENEEMTEKNSDLILDVAAGLGLIGADTTCLDVINYILPLGGARMSNLRRCELARAIIDCTNTTGARIVALSGMRPLAQSEIKGYTETYAPGAIYEFDAISSGLEQSFSCKNGYTSRTGDDPNPNLQSVIRHYTERYAGNDIYSIAAPSTDPERRANSADCFEFFFKSFKVPEGSSLLNCTSQIYCTYQQVRALFFAIEHNVIFDTVGFSFGLNNPNGKTDPTQLSKPVNYLQEIKATIDAMYDFMIKYQKE